MKPIYSTVKQQVYHAVLITQINLGVCIAQAILDAKNAAKAVPDK